MDGYEKLAALMGERPTLGIFRRFSSLGAQNLLYLQAELVSLESELKRCALEDNTSGDEEKLDYAVNWYSLMRSEEKGESIQWTIMKDIRKKLAEYNEAFLQQSFMAATQPPTPTDLEFLKLWLQRGKQGNCTLIGLDSDVWDTSPSYELTALKRQASDDQLSSWILNRFIVWWHRHFSHLHKSDAENLYVEYKDHKLLRVAMILGTTVATVLPLTSIVVLYLVTNLGIRLGLVACFTFVFSLLLVTLTRARMIEIFSATSAFAAVQVVFVGGTNNT